MLRSLLLLLFNLIGISLFIIWVVRQYKKFTSHPKGTPFFTWQRYGTLVMGICMVAVVFVVVHFTSLPAYVHSLMPEEDGWPIFSVGISFLISMVWLRYLLKLDVFEPEKWYHIALIFILATASSYLCDILYPAIHALGLTRSADPFNDFLYCVFGIGLIEETVKFIPFMIMLRFTKAINEPYDYLLYASICGLGFAFAENAMYIGNYGPQNIPARAFYATVAHMTFSSTVAYGMLLWQYRFQQYPRLLVYVFFFGIAMFSHGFYDFWLLNPTVKEFSGITTIFFMITIHIWFIMKNNAINLSNFYNEDIEVNNQQLTQYLTLSFVGLGLVCYFFMAVGYGAKGAWNLLIRLLSVYGYVVFYLIATLRDFNIVQGVLKPFNVPFTFFVPTLPKKQQ